MKKWIIWIIIALSPALVVQTAGAAAPAWDFDPGHGSFFFDIKHIYYITRGYFEDYSGSFRFDPENLDESSIEITIKTASLTTQHEKRDRHVRSADFMDVKQFPEMRFQSSRIRHLQDNSYEMAGRLTIKDVTKEIVVPFTFFGVQDNPFNSKQLVAGFEARFTIDRLQYNVGSGKYYEMGVIGKDVDILISLEMLRAK